MKISLVWIGLSLFLTGCHSQVDTTPVAPSVERGKTVYQTYCIACHSSDPHKPGSVGPEIFGSSYELLEARVLRGEYPQGHTPKRTTHSMPPIPQLKNDLQSLKLFLNN